jgi:hypothetical protein
MTAPEAPPSGLADPASDTATEAELRAEIARLRAIVGPSEDTYLKLQLDLLGARDAAVASESELGRLRGYAKFFRKHVLTRMRKVKRLTEAMSRFVHQLLRG